MTEANHWSTWIEAPIRDNGFWSEYFYWQAAKYFKEHPEELGAGPSEEVKQVLQRAMERNKDWLKMETIYD